MSLAEGAIPNGPFRCNTDHRDRTDSQVSDESDFDPDSETLGDRLYALRDIIPPTTRGWISHRISQTASLARTASTYGAKAAYIFCTSALLIGVPWALAWAEDQNIQAMEQEHRMREMGGEMLVAGTEDSEAQRVSAALGQESGRAVAKPAL